MIGYVGSEKFIKNYKSYFLIQVKMLTLGLILAVCSATPTPIMTFPENGVYSLFPNENLETGKTTFRFEDDRDRDPVRSIRDRERERDRGQFSPSPPYPLMTENRRERDPFSFNRDQFHDLRTRNPRVYFDDDTHRFARPHQNSFLPSLNNYPPPPSPDQNFHHHQSRPGLINRPLSPLHPNYLPPSFPPRRPGFSESKLPPRHGENFGNDDVPPRIHVFNPDSGNFGHPRNSGGNRNPSNNFIEVGPPGPDLFLNHDEYLNYHTKLALARLEDANTNNKDAGDGKKLLFTAKKPFQIDGLVPPESSQEQEQLKKKLEVEHTTTEKNTGGGGGGSNSGSEEVEEDDDEPQAKSENGKSEVTQIAPTFLSKSGQKKSQRFRPSSQNNDKLSVTTGVSSSPIHNFDNGGFVPLSFPFHNHNEGAESPRAIKTTLPKAEKSGLGTEVTKSRSLLSSNTRLFTSTDVQKEEKDALLALRERVLAEMRKHLLSQHQRKQLTGTAPPVTQTSSDKINDNFKPLTIKENDNFRPLTIKQQTIPLPPRQESSLLSQFDNTDHDDIHSHFLLPPSGPEDSEGPTLIFLESSETQVNNSNPVATSNLIKVMRVKSTTSAASTSMSSSSSSATAAAADASSSSTKAKTSSSMFLAAKNIKFKNASIKESTSSNISQSSNNTNTKFKFSSTDFKLNGDFSESDFASSSPKGVVEKVHAHISHCPKLHSPAEVICDVHIRSRHGFPNPQLIVGWRRKFHNETHPDVLLALNKTLAYDDNDDLPSLKDRSTEDFHDKFNVTLAPGISPMLRSVLLIRAVTAPDCGNYQCEVFDGKYTLKSETLLFLCH